MKRKAWLILGALFLVVVPLMALAQTPLVPCSGAPGDECQLCRLVELIDNVTQWLVTVLSIIAAIMIAYSGYLLVTSAGNKGQKEQAKKTIFNTIIGFVIVLAAWLLIDLMMQVLVTGQVNTGPWNQIQCVTQPTANIVYTPLYTPQGTGNTFGTGTLSTSTAAAMNNIGTGNTAIVACAQAFDAQQCLYDQSRRNGCTGNPGYTDCSDLVNVCYQHAGCRSPGGTTAAMYPNAAAITNPGNLQPGDAIVYRYSCRTGTCGHVVICMNVGCSSVIHAQGRGAPSGQPATIAPQNQITTGNGSQYINRSGARVIQASAYCP